MRKALVCSQELVVWHVTARWALRYLVWELFEPLLEVECDDHNVHWIGAVEFWWDNNGLKKLADFRNGMDVGEVVCTL